MDAWLEQKQKELDESAAERKARIKADYEAKKQKEIESIATEWAKREYFRKATSGDMPYSEAEYIKSVWERAMFEGDLKYRMLHGQATDERKELAEFKKKQEKKKTMMLERAKAELDEILSDEADDEDNTDDDDDDDE
jgi:phosphopantetheinyl transferase (holo-ACP synthase)